jgi:hypothetical protein
VAIVEARTSEILIRSMDQQTTRGSLGKVESIWSAIQEQSQIQVLIELYQVELLHTQNITQIQTGDHHATLESTASESRGLW